MIEIKPLLNDEIYEMIVKEPTHNERMVAKKDIILLLQNLHSTEDEELAEAVIAICKDFDLEYSDYVNGTVEEAAMILENWYKIEEAAWHE